MNQLSIWQRNPVRTFVSQSIQDLTHNFKVPHFSARKDFKAVLGRMGLQARGTAGVDSASTGGTWDISNADRLGKSEVELVNIFIEGVAQIIRWEQALEAGQNIDAEVAATQPPVAKLFFFWIKLIGTHRIR